MKVSQKRYLILTAVGLVIWMLTAQIIGLSDRLASSVGTTTEEATVAEEITKAPDQAEITENSRLWELLQHADTRRISSEWLMMTLYYAQPNADSLLLIHREHRPTETIWCTVSNYDGSGDHYLFQEGSWYHYQQKYLFNVGIHQSIPFPHESDIDVNPPADAEWIPIDPPRIVPLYDYATEVWRHPSSEHTLPAVIFSFDDLLEGDIERAGLKKPRYGVLTEYGSDCEICGSTHDCFMYKSGKYELTVHDSFQLVVLYEGNGILYEYTYCFETAFTLPTVARCFPGKIPDMKHPSPPHDHGRLQLQFIYKLE